MLPDVSDVTHDSMRDRVQHPVTRARSELGDGSSLQREISGDKTEVASDGRGEGREARAATEAPREGRAERWALEEAGRVDQPDEPV